VSDLTREQFLKHLRDALNHLRDPNYLRQSPLAAAFGVANQPDTPAALRCILVDAIKSLKPEADEPPQSRAWRLYESLLYRYVQYFSQLEVADQLGISTRQLRREQRAALETLAYQLWEQLAVEGQRDEKPSYEDLAWLKDTPPESPTDLKRELPAVLELTRPLATQHGVHLALAVDDDLPQAAADPVALRQTLISLLSAAIPRASSCHHVRVAARSLPREVAIEVECARPGRLRVSTPGQPARSSDNDAARLDMARQLADLCGGSLTISDSGEGFSARLIVPALGQLPVLAIDDNAGTLRLLQRYTAGTRYRLVGTPDPEQALALAQELAPHVIVLDVMMPHVDGWEILGRLRQHPLTAHIPIVVCTILAEEELALSLGASAFVRKPVTRQAFLAALDRLIRPGRLRVGTPGKPARSSENLPGLRRQNLADSLDTA
jgi:CheY-like chemotaxis protein